MKRDIVDGTYDRPSASILTVLLELFIIGDFEADEIWLYGSHDFLHLLN